MLLIVAVVVVVVVIIAVDPVMMGVIIESIEAAAQKTERWKFMVKFQPYPMLCVQYSALNRGSDHQEDSKKETVSHFEIRFPP